MPFLSRYLLQSEFKSLVERALLRHDMIKRNQDLNMHSEEDIQTNANDVNPTAGTNHRDINDEYNHVAVDDYKNVPFIAETIAKVRYTSAWNICRYEIDC